jgi:primosomal protein N' (replication factor Y)
MQAKVVVLGSAGDLAPLTYAIAPALATAVKPGHRVIVPLGSRRMTGMVIEVGAFDSAGKTLKPIAELLEPQPLFDQPHLELVNFLASYYLAPIAEAYRSVVPSLVRIESHRRYRLEAAPAPLMRAALTPLEREIIAALERHPMTPRQLRRLGSERELATALGRLVAERIVAEETATLGRHREAVHLRVRATIDPTRLKLRGPRQREVMALLAAASADGLPLDELRRSLGEIGPLLRVLSARGWIAIEPGAPAENAVVAADGDGNETPLKMNDEQQAAFNAIAPAIENRRDETFLLWGVTASGKTEIYLSLAARALGLGRNVILLVPEIALTDQLVRAFRRRFGALVAIAHSAQNVAERWTNWRAALAGRARIMIGPRSAIFAPLHDPGLIVVDEEHDAAYKNEEGIRYNARDLAVALGRFARCPVVLGSATPSAESWANARNGRYRMLKLVRRVMERPFAAVEIVDLRRGAPKPGNRAQPAPDDAEAGGPVPLSEPLLEAIQANLTVSGQTILFLNRRGYHNFLQCHNCGAVLTCPNCSVSQTFHLRDRSLRCHYCGERRLAPEDCPECRAPGLEGLGFGTERLVAALAKIVPAARVERMDSDTSGRRGERSRMLAALERGEIDILVGTQMVTKGFDFPGVTLVGVILADVALNLPDFRSAERTFQLLTQVAGRAGRGERPGRVLIQTYAPGHYSIRAARDQDYERFMRRELTLRRELGYPPFTRLAMVRIESEDSAAAARVAADAAAALKRAAASAAEGALRVLGPAPAPIERLRGRYRFQVMVKSTALSAMRAALGAMRAALKPEAAVRVAIDIDPLNML